MANFVGGLITAKREQGCYCRTSMQPPKQEGDFGFLQSQKFQNLFQGHSWLFFSHFPICLSMLTKDWFRVSKYPFYCNFVVHPLWLLPLSTCIFVARWSVMQRWTTLKWLCWMHQLPCWHLACEIQEPFLTIVAKFEMTWDGKLSIFKVSLHYKKCCHKLLEYYIHTVGS